MPATLVTRTRKLATYIKSRKKGMGSGVGGDIATRLRKAEAWVGEVGGGRG